MRWRWWCLFATSPDPLHTPNMRPNLGLSLDVGLSLQQHADGALVPIVNGVVQRSIAILNATHT